MYLINRIIFFSIFIIFFQCVPLNSAYSQQRLTIDPEQSSIQGIIRYTLIGKYIADFKRFSGEVTFQSESQKITGATLTIDTESIQSKHPRLDAIVRSSRLLDTKTYPNITFQSQSIKSQEGHYLVEGTLTLHGVTQNISFPFEIDGDIKTMLDKGYIKARGQWRIPRKDFRIIWHKVLDKGGFLVSNLVIVDWEIIAR